MKIYLDTSVYNRPFDDQTQPRIWLETLALALIPFGDTYPAACGVIGLVHESPDLQLVEEGEAVLINSSVLEFENSQNPFSLRRDWMARCLQQATVYQRVNQSIRERAEALEKHGLRPIDSLQVACAEAADADYFLTCDDRLAKKQKYLTVSSMNPIDFVQRVVGEQP